jgi:hypothetical protein
MEKNGEYEHIKEIGVFCGRSMRTKNKKKNEL